MNTKNESCGDHRSRAAAPPRRGFTLVEAFVSLVVIASIGGVAGSVLLRGAEAHTQTVRRLELLSELGAALDRIDRAVREIPRDAAAVGPALVEVSPTLIRWTDASARACRIEYVGGQLLLATEGETPTSILDGATACVIRTFDESANLLPASLNGSAVFGVRRVEITLTASRDGMTETLRTRVFPRCMMRESGV